VSKLSHFILFLYSLKEAELKPPSARLASSCFFRRAVSERKDVVRSKKRNVLFCVHQEARRIFGVPHLPRSRTMKCLCASGLCVLCPASCVLCPLLPPRPLSFRPQMFPVPFRTRLLCVRRRGRDKKQRITITRVCESPR